MEDLNTNSKVIEIEKQKGLKLLEEVLKYQPEETKEKIYWWIKVSKVKPQDPLFLLLLGCRVVQVLFEKAPDEISGIYEQKNSELYSEYVKFLERLQEQFSQHLNETDTYLKRLENLAIQSTREKLAKAVNQIIEESKKSDRGSVLKWSFSPQILFKILGAASTALVMVGGFIGGSLYTARNYAVREAVYLNAEEQVLLKWAKSREGQLARDLVTWNEDLLDKSCKKKVEALGVTIQIGKAQATNGYCWLWVEPASKRKFKVAES